jgi:multiple sugar transport system substrate-binding protein
MLRRSALGGVAVMLLLFTLIACGGSGSGSGSGSGGGSLTVWTFESNAAEKTAFQKITDQFHKTNPNVKISWVYVPEDDLDTKLLAAAGTHTGPDVIMADREADLPGLISSGVFADLSQYWSKYADRSKYPDVAIFKSKGKVFTVQAFINLLGLWYNKDILDQLGISPPTTIQELGQDLAKVKASGQYQGLTLAGVPTFEGAWQAMPWLFNNGVTYCNIGTPATTEVFSMLSDWRTKGYIPREAASWDQTTSYQQFLGGKFAFAENGNWEITNTKNIAKFHYGVVQFPTGSSGSHVLLGGPAEGIDQYSNNKDLAWKFLQSAFLSKQGSTTLYQGIGGVPSRTDVDTSGDTMIQPFAKAIKTAGALPDNKNAIKAQDDLGTVYSSMLSGALGPEAAAQQASQKVRADLKSGGGSC